VFRGVLHEEICSNATHHRRNILSESREEYLQDAAKTIFATSLAACSVEQAFFSRFIPSDPARPYSFHLVGDGEIDLSGLKRLIVISVGKGAATMLQSLLERLPRSPGCLIDGVLVAPARPAVLPHGIQFFQGGHPLPNAESMAGASAALAVLHSAATSPDASETFCFFLISGGASAMMELPLDESISSEDVNAFHQVLVHCGANIADINSIRKHFSAVKGGRLGLASLPLRSISLLVSDVPADHLDALGSGPTVPDPSTVEQCRAILERHQLLPQFPVSVRRFFSSDRLIETPKPGALPTHVYLLLSSNDLSEAASAKAESLGYTAVIDNTCDDWDFRLAAEYLVARLRDLRRQYGRVCLISSGEVTVRLPSDDGSRAPFLAGLGGRNQHFALYAQTLLRPEDRPVVIFSAGSDGIDGNSPAAGAFVTPQQGRDQRADEALQNFDSFTYLNERGATVLTGPTGNNLRDLRLLLAE
jgi:glycerate 2-kinase